MSRVLAGDQVVLMTPSSQASLRTNSTSSPTPERTTPTCTSLMHNTLTSPTPDPLSPGDTLTDTEPFPAIDTRGYLTTEAVRDLQDPADTSSPALALPMSTSIGAPPPPECTVRMSCMCSQPVSIHTLCLTLRTWPQGWRSPILAS